MIKLPEPDYVSNEDEFIDIIHSTLVNILDKLVDKKIISNYFLLKKFGLDIAAFLEVGDKYLAKFIEIKLYKGQRQNGVGFGDKRGEGNQVELLLLTQDKLFLADNFIRWILADMTKQRGTKRYVFFNNNLAIESAMGGVKKGKQNNFNVRILLENAITWNQLLEELKRFLI